MQLSRSPAWIYACQSAEVLKQGPQKGKVFSCAIADLLQESPASVLEYVRGSSLRSGLQKLKQYRIPNDRRVRAAIALQAARGALQPPVP